MSLLQSIHELPKLEKLKVMEFIWQDLKGEYKSPSWHQYALQETEKKLAAGEEKIVDWGEAKKLLRNNM